MNAVSASAALASADMSSAVDGPPGATLDSLAALRIWVAWVLTPGRDATKLLQKVPYAATTCGRASVDKPNTWGSRLEAQASADQLLAGGKQGGIGIMLGALPDGSGTCVGGIDLDTCRDRKTGLVEGWALEILKRFSSYAEVSPSGTGLKLYFTYKADDLPALQPALGSAAMGKSWKRGSGQHPPAIELYFAKRWFALTGQRHPDAPPELHSVGLERLLQLIRTDGPAFSANRTAGTAAPTKPRDNTRSGRAFGLAGKVRARGGTVDDFKDALAEDGDLAEWANDARQVNRAWARAGADGVGGLKGFAFNEDGVALAFKARFKDLLRYDHDIGQWFRWNGNYWQQDGTRLAYNWARETCRDMAAVAPWSLDLKPLAKAATAGAVERYAIADRAFAVTSEIWNRDPWLLGTPGGTVDLRTGKLRPAEQGDFITKLTSVMPTQCFVAARDCPLWLAFLSEATGGDADLIRFLQQWGGYSLTGDTREHALLFVYGPGGNGKSVFLNVTSGILHDYCRTAGMDVLTAAKGERHTQELARLKGARMVCASETEEGRAWAEVRVKQLTGGDIITARLMRQNDSEFRPEFKLTVIGNNKPILHNVDEAARRRLNLVPFEHQPAVPDRELESKLLAEAAGILAWYLEGCLDWQAVGLQRPKSVVDATAEYFDSQDLFGQWIDERCERGPSFASSTAILIKDWEDFAASTGEATRICNRTFADRLRAKRFLPVRNTHGVSGRGFRGLRPIASGAASASFDDL